MPEAGQGGKPGSIECVGGVLSDSALPGIGTIAVEAGRERVQNNKKLENAFFPVYAASGCRKGSKSIRRSTVTAGGS